ncbi:putative bifunctional diguanylate cyclase/phosphodiesterase [Geodermatophilus ruber]|uniref:Diguanylate cyclase (GGDEF) domain-containing protein n=1 Tax=Geodermatophilus ruber TaxID=504800 RepID=A0A1I4DHH3_9ACTN|nr:EAL domain-containing protein [Geodermatophilus ruber]SFK92675.1 diguanylate cyclase (GGDEF) domain-containing protein [Geodermatophilus ruber]
MRQALGGGISEEDARPRSRAWLATGGWYLAAAAGLGIVVLLFQEMLLSRAVNQMLRSENMAAQAGAVQVESDRVLDLLVEAESGQRGYLLTGRREFLTSYEAAAAQVPAALQHLSELDAGYVHQHDHVRQLEELAAAKRQELAAAVELSRAGDDAAMATTVGGPGRQLMAELRAVDAALTEELDAEVAIQGEASARALDRAQWVSGTGTVLILGLLITMLGLVRHRGRLEARRAQDARERSRLMDQLAHLATHDALTGLPNRRLLRDRIDQALARSAQDRTLIAVFFIDLDHFKHVNDSRGHAVGDEVLAQLARRLRAQLRGTDTLARVGGDEFVVVCEGLTSAAQADEIAAGLADRLTGGLEVAGQRVPVSFSLGLVVAAHDRICGEAAPRALTAETLLNAADAAMYAAKDAGRAQRRHYDPAEARRRTEREGLAADLGIALAEGQLWVAYQPLVRLVGNEPVGVEALLRWDHPTRGPVSPATFIPVAEESGLIVPIGAFVLRQACAQVVAWNALRQHHGRPPLHASVNVSARQLLAPEFLDLLERTIRDSGLPAELLTLEITESVLLDSVNGAADRIEQIAATGVRLALDDFGTGYSSLSYLRRFPVETIKVDRSFTAGLGHSDADEAIISAVVSLADRLGRRVLVEGIETPDQARHVARLGAHLGQGDLYGRPTVADQLHGMLLIAPPDPRPVLDGAVPAASRA